MAQLQLAVCSHMNPTASSPSVPATNQARCHSGVLKEASQLQNLTTNIQQQLLCQKDKKFKELHISKQRSCSYSQPAENTQLILEKAGCYSAGSHNWYFKDQASTLPSQWKTKRREGVDRAYPLKPVFHQQSGTTVLPSSWQVRNPQARTIPSCSTNSEKKKVLHTVKAQPVGVPSPFSVEQSSGTISHSQRAESGYIQKLEAAGRSLEEEIQRKEALLREKLRRTEGELRKIQQKKQQAEAETKREQGELWMPQKKMLGIPQDNYSRSPAQLLDDDPKLPVPEGITASADAVLLPETLHMERLRKQLLIVSNSKSRENAPHISSTYNLERAPMNDQPTIATSLGHADSVVAESYMEAPYSGEEWGECRFCGRKLYCSRLAKHISICSKNHGSKRKVFDSSKARAKGTELETYHLLKGSDISQKKISSQSSGTSKQSNWRQKHESFIKTLRRAREVQRIISKGGKASDLPPVPALENPDYKLCPYCTRQFAPKVAERHIPKCKNIRNRPPPPQQKRRC